MSVSHWWASYDDALEIRPLVSAAMLLSSPLVRGMRISNVFPMLLWCCNTAHALLQNVALKEVSQLRNSKIPSILRTSPLLLSRSLCVVPSECPPPPKCIMPDVLFYKLAPSMSWIALACGPYFGFTVTVAKRPALSMLRVTYLVDGS